MTTSIALTSKQRYLYNYYLHHRKHNKASPCFVPRFLSNTKVIDAHLKALEKLEQLNLVSVDRRASNYTGWIILPPAHTTFT
jgi:hypothetical protein